MKKLIYILIVALLASSLASPSVFAKSDNAKESLVAVGDSIPFGLNLGQTNQNPAKTSYPYVIGKLADLRVRNLGVSGWQSVQLLEALKTDQKYRQAIIHSDYVAVTIGNNDLLAILREAAAESGGNQVLFQQLLGIKLNQSDVFSNIQQIISEIRTLTDSPILLYNVYNPFQLTDPLHYVADSILPAINLSLTAFAFANKDIFLADAYTAFGNQQALYVLPGDIHPTNAGQAKLAETGLNALGL